MNAKKLMKLLTSAVQDIDGGCAMCANDFCTSANDVLEEAGSNLRFLFVRDNTHSFHVEVEVIEMAPVV